MTKNLSVEFQKFKLVVAINTAGVVKTALSWLRFESGALTIVALKIE